MSFLFMVVYILKYFNKITSECAQYIATYECLKEYCQQKFNEVNTHREREKYSCVFISQVSWLLTENLINL